MVAARASHPRPSVTALDHRLYGWLIETDERRFRRAFDRYFQLAFPAVVRHLSRLSRWDEAPLEDLAQDAMLRFFDRVGRGRRDATESVVQALPRIIPVGLGSAHERRVRTWCADVEAFTDAATHFAPPQADDLNDVEWKSRIRLLADRIPRLQAAGRSLIEEAGVALRWRPATTQGSDAASVSDLVVGELTSGSDRASVAERELPGVARLVPGIAVITTALPRLRVPTNAYLFEIAMSLYLDECKRRARKKRGGTGVAAAARVNGSAPSGPAADDPERPFPDHPDGALEGGNPLVEVSDLSLEPRAASDRGAPGVDPTPRYEHEQFFQKFYEYLRRPVDDATEAFAGADSGDESRAARRRLESVSRKFSRTVSVLSMLGEGHTQEQTAARLGLSRNQVKYIVELVKDAYAGFVAKSEGVPVRSAGGGAHPHVS